MLSKRMKDKMKISGEFAKHKDRRQGQSVMYYLLMSMHYML